MKKTIDQIADVIRDKAMEALKQLVSDSAYVDVSDYDIEEIITDYLGENIEFTADDMRNLGRLVDFGRMYAKIARPYHALVPGAMTEDMADKLHSELESDGRALSQKIDNITSRMAT